MCLATTPKVRKAPPPPRETTTTTVDDAVLVQSQRERRRNATRFGQKSTVVAGNVSAPTGQQKTLLGS